ncbi:DUF6603 domain-containing protein [Micromonospora sp. RTP1Z1]|uniref:DUF6603 domain-containing protein n=1 Tax=Micromonospora sp. RTP1Z1 TaxID=2994043 RepID=UPI0029C69DC1|nr:DUF6603 domain-containing protein [Micromonospora sp. RTP1Z1]
MGLAIGVDQRLVSALRAVGILGPDGGVDPTWFDHPLDALRKTLSDPAQRAAVVQLLDDALPPTPGPWEADGSRWHPMLPANTYGNVYLTVTDTVFGVAARAAGPWTGPPGVDLTLTLPLVDVVGGQMTAVAGSPAGPLRVALRVDLGADSIPSAVGVAVTVDATGAAVRVRLEQADPDGTLRVTELDPTRADAQTVQAVQALLLAFLDREFDPDPRVRRVVEHLPGLFGLGDPQLTPLPLADLARDPGQARTWAASIATRPASLVAWFTHAAGLIGALPLVDPAGHPAPPQVSGAGTDTDPLRATLVDLGDGIDIGLLLGVTAGAAPALQVGVELGVPLAVAGRDARLDAQAMLAAFPLAGTAPTTVLPAARLKVAVGVLDGHVEGGATWDGARLSPLLGLRAVTIAGTTRTVDLSSADAVVEAVADTVVTALEQAVGLNGTGRHALALLGLADPATAPGWTHRLGADLFSGEPLAAVGRRHLAALDDSATGWGPLFAELAGLLGLTVPAGAGGGHGTLADPWRATIVDVPPTDDAPGLALQLVAWDAADDTTPAGAHRLRIGLRAAADIGAWTASWACEVVGFDLASAALTAVRFVGAQHVEVLLGALPELGGDGGLSLAAQGIAARLDWLPGSPLSAGIELRDLVLVDDGPAPRQVGPLTLRLPPPGLDLTAPDLGASTGFGLDEEVLPDLLSLLLGHALRLWGPDSTAHVIGGVLGLHADLAGLPADWPRLIPATTADLAALLRDPLPGLTAHLRRLLTGGGADGPYAPAALRWIGVLLADAAPTTPDAEPAPALTVTGAGTDDDPWAMPLFGTGETLDGPPDAELLLWLDPPPPGGTGAGSLRAAGDGQTLLARLAAATGTGDTPAAAALRGRDTATAGPALDRLAGWLADGDGLVPYAAATAVPASWTVGTPATCPHDALPADPATIAQVAARLTGWGAGPGCPVLLLSTVTSTADWSALLASVDPGHHPDADLDLGIAAAAYRLTLDDTDTDGSLRDLDALAGQVQAAITRVRAATGAASVCLVGHGPGGVLARVVAARTPATVRGVVSLGAPHGGSTLLPLTDTDVADAARLARLLTDPAGPDTAALDMIVARLDGGPARRGVLPPAGAYHPDAFTGPPAAGAEPVPGLAIGARLSAGLITRLAAAAADTVPTTTAAGTTAPPATHIGLGVRVAACTRTGGGDLTLDGQVRLDATRIRIAPGPEPARPAQRLRVGAWIGRDGAWLAGDPGARDTGAGPRAVLRIRAAEVDVVVDRAATGGVDVTVSAAGYEAGPPGASEATVPLARFATTVRDLQAGTLGAGRRPIDNLLDLLLALDQAPGPALAQRLPDLLQLVLPAIGATRVAEVPGGWQLPVLGETLQVLLTPAPWRLHLRTAPAPAGAGEDWQPRLDVDAALGLPGFDATVRVGAAFGPLRVTWSGGGAPPSLVVAMPPWLPDLTELPAPPPADLAAAVVAALPGALASAALAIAVQPSLGPAARAVPLSRLLAAPGPWLRGALGRTDGAGFDAAALDGLLGVVSALLGATGGADGAGNGLTLPGGLTLRARPGQNDPTGTTVLRLTGTVPLDGTSLQVTLGLALRAPAGQPIRVAPEGSVTVEVTLPGDWGAITLAAGADAAGLALSVTPHAGADPGTRIDLLPQFSGLGALAQAATRLLPHLLQQLVDELRPAGGGAPTGLLAAVLDVATALDIYGDDAQGFEEPQRAARLSAMLTPGWWQQQATDPAYLATLVARLVNLFGAPPLLPFPIGTAVADGGTVVWSITPTGAGPLSVQLGWGTTGEPVLALGASGLRLGPVTLDSAMLGLSPRLNCRVLVHLAVDGVLAVVQPALDVDVDIDTAHGTVTFAVRLLPLGVGTGDDLAIAFAPALKATASDEAPLMLVEQWGIPIAGEVLLRAIDGQAPGASTTPLLKRPLWTDGPTTETILTASGLVETASGSLRITRTLPDIGGAVLKALQAAATGIPITITPDLHLMLMSEPVTGGSRTGVRLRGHADIEAGDLTVRLRFGDADWLATDPNRGVTAWLVEPDPAGPLPLRLAVALRMVGVGIGLARTDDTPLVDGVVVIGSAGGLMFLDATFVEAGAAKLAVAGLGAALQIEQASVNVAGQDGDSFVAKILPPELAAPFDLAVIYRDGTLRIEGSIGPEPGRIELTIPLDLDLAVIRITELMLALQTGGGPPSIELALSGGADLGPVHGVVQRVGIAATFGSTGAQLRFRPPDMVGLSIDTPTLRLGGFLLVDAEHGRYIGAIEIAVLQKFELSAVGLITTRNPDGTPGFSLLFIISIVFPVPITLGYGFFFAGAGGLLGLNRSVDLDRLRLGLRAGTADSILFPTDVVHRATAIVHDLETVFPVAPGQFLIGPMAMITWSTPPLITIKLGIILELGAQVKVAILGAVRAALPTADEPVLDLKAAFLGTVDVAAQLLTFDVAIYDSFLGAGDYKFTFEGDIAVRLSWSKQPDFVLSVGGFHPSYTPAPYLKLPVMRRISISLMKDNPRLTLGTYLAVTANTVQMGARLDFAFAVSGFSIEGDFGFDVLFQFSPFRFDAHAWAHLAVKAAGSVLLCLTLDFTLRGPAPWTAHGTASFSILFFSVSVEFEAHFGEALEDAAHDIALLPKILAEFARTENWEGRLAVTATSAVTLLPIPATVIDAGGSLTVSQRVLPLNTTITMFGTSHPSDLSRVDIGPLRIGTGTGTADTRTVTEPFSPAAFTALSDEDKLRSPAFEQRAAGVQVTSGTGLSTTYAVVRPARFDVIVVDEVPAPTAAGGGAGAGGAPVLVSRTLDAAELVRQARHGAAGRSPAAARLRQERQAGSVLDVAAPRDRYAVTAGTDLRPLDAAGQPVAPTGSDPHGLPVYPDGTLLALSDAQARRAALGGQTQIVPAAQLPAVQEVSA